MSKSEKSSHPGKVLKEKFLIPKSISISEFSNKTGITKRYIEEIVIGKRAISKTTAKIFSKILNTKIEYWIDLQRDYDIFIARKLLKGIIPENDAIEEVMVNNPHDKLIKIVFSDRNEAVEFFQKNLPPDLAQQLDWDTLELEGSKYIDEELKDSESDLLYSVYFKDSNDKCFLYLLFEHQSTPDKWLRFRIIKYKTRVWDESINKYKDQENLIPILSMVLYIGSNEWTYSPEFSDLICKTNLDSKYIPKFEHVLWDFSSKSKKLKGAVKAQIAHLLIQAHFHGILKEVYQTLVEYLSQIKKTQGINYLKVFFIYLAATQPKNDVKGLIQFIKKDNKQKGGKQMIEILEELRDEGRYEGRIEGEFKKTIDIIENMLNANFDWQSIQKITGVDNNQFEEIKTKLQQFQIAPFIAEQSLSDNHISYSQTSDSR